MRKKLAGVLITAGLLVVGVGAAPAAAQAPTNAKGCPFIGESWSEWAQYGPEGHPETGDATGEWTGRVASTQETDYPVDGGPGVVSQVLAYYCEEVA